ncbi:MAG: HugZ family pyridoxamine 5'-phosphate oxidase [Candidatus Thorarchaeota archaeon]|jgi:putative heme iron utilization protein
MYKVILAFALMCSAVVAAEEESTEKKAAEFLKKNQVGVLGTFMKEDAKSYPYLSIVPYALDDGKPFIFISDLAQHTENLNENGKSSIVVYTLDPDDIHNATRATFQGTLVKLKQDGKEYKRLAKIYVKRFPKSKILLTFGDFNFYRMEVKQMHWIGGFGDIDWANVKKYLKESE